MAVKRTYRIINFTYKSMYNRVCFTILFVLLTPPVLIYGQENTYIGNQLTVHINANTLVHVNGNLTINTDADSPLENDGNLQLDGNWINNAIFNEMNGTVFFTGNLLQSLGGSTTPDNFHNLNINNSGIGVRLNKDINITNNFHLANGAFNLNNNLTVITNAAVNAISRTNGFILSNFLDQDFNSRLQWNIGTTTGLHLYPFGVDVSDYIPFTFNLTSENIGNVTVSTFPSDGFDEQGVSNDRPTSINNLDGDCGNGLPGSSECIARRFWNITKSDPNGVATITYTYSGTEEPLNGETADMTAQRYFNNNWEAPLPNQTSNATGNTVTVPDVTLFSTWRIIRGSIPLPIELIYFNAVCENGKTELNWVTASETNNDFFIIEKSPDGVEFQYIANIEGAGNSYSLNEYRGFDENPFPDITYYRLKQIDFDGNSNVYKKISVECNNSNLNFELINIIIDSRDNPNQITVLFNAYNNENYAINLFDICGKIILIKMNNAINGLNIEKINVESLEKGIYIISLSTKNTVISKILFI